MAPALAFAHTEPAPSSVLEINMEEIHTEAIGYAKHAMDELLNEVANSSSSENLGLKIKQTEDNNNTGLQNEGVTELAYRD